MHTRIQKVTAWVSTHKKTAAILGIILAGALYEGFGLSVTGTTEPRYVLATAERGTITSTVNGTGQVSAAHEITITSKASGQIVALNAVAGQEVATSTLLAQLDATDAAYERDTAKLSYDKTATISPDDLRTARNTLDEAQATLKDAYADGRAALAASVTDMSSAMDDSKALFQGYLNTANRPRLTKTAKDYAARAEQSYDKTADLQYQFMKTYRTTSGTADNTALLAILSDANNLANAIAETAKYIKDAVVYLRNQEEHTSSTAEDAYTSATALTANANATVSDTLSAKNAILDAERKLDVATQALNDIQDGPDTLDLRAEELSLRQKQTAYADHFIRAPFSGLIASVAVKDGESVSNGSTIATIISKQKVADISLNEIDAAKVQIGQKATLTFDALEDVTVTGSVIAIDLVGTVSQGVVNYMVTIGFDTDNDMVRSGMTVNADIVTASKEDVVTVPLSAVKTHRTGSYVDIASDAVPTSTRSVKTVGVTFTTPPTARDVVIGVANDDTVEVISGLEEGETYVVRTITATATAAKTTAPSLFGGGGSGQRTGGGNFAR